MGQSSVQSSAQSSNQNWQKNTAQNSQQGQQRGLQQAQRMVPARASLSQTLDADRTTPGYQFRATLRDTVRLENGVKLHRGDVLLGRVVTDDMNTAGKSRLALRFTQAVLKHGQTIPVKATIVAFYKPSDFLDSEYAEPQQIPNNWNDGTLRVDDIGVMKDVDLHSRIASRDSGVFVSTKDNVRIPRGSEIALAIAARGNGGPANAMNGGF
ncbi:MAG TPA: hypothetical protein VHY48_14495 [Acidobacteriaceae bacterium]|nr:hypothetical protein [Acidobacteriaceae bacterium]